MFEKYLFSNFTSNESQIRMQAQGSVIQGGMMGNFIQIYQKEGTKGLWKASFSNYIPHSKYAFLLH